MPFAWTASSGTKSEPSAERNFKPTASKPGSQHPKPESSHTPKPNAGRGTAFQSTSSLRRDAWAQTRIHGPYKGLRATRFNCIYVYARIDEDSYAACQQHQEHVVETCKQHHACMLEYLYMHVYLRLCQALPGILSYPKPLNPNARDFEPETSSGKSELRERKALTLRVLQA